MTFRFATQSDIPLILKLIRELAEYEKLLNEVTADEETLGNELFKKNKAEVLLGFDGNDVVGYALFFHNFSTFLGKSGIYLEDLYVRPEMRKRGFGKAFLKELAKIANERGCGRLEWCCLDWNTPSIDFYLSLGAKKMDGWTIFRVEGETLRDFAD